MKEGLRVPLRRGMEKQSLVLRGSVGTGETRDSQPSRRWDRSVQMDRWTEGMRVDRQYEGRPWRFRRE